MLTALGNIVQVLVRTYAGAHLGLSIVLLGTGSWSTGRVLHHAWHGTVRGRIARGVAVVNRYRAVHERNIVVGEGLADR